MFKTIPQRAALYERGEEQWKEIEPRHQNKHQRK